MLKAEKVHRGYETLTSNDFRDWMQYEFEVFDADEDGYLEKEEFESMLAHVIGVYKAYLKDTLAKHVRYLSLRLLSVL